MTHSADYDAGLRHPWVVTGDGGSWSITSTNGDIIASEIPHGIVADYIAELHNTRVTPPEVSGHEYGTNATHCAHGGSLGDPCDDCNLPPDETAS